WIARGNGGGAKEKGRVEWGVGYVKKTFLRGLELTEFGAIQAAAKVWLDTTANVRIHGETHQRPVDMFVQERQHLRPLNQNRYDVARTLTARASSQFRITVDTNRYSLPCASAPLRLTVKPIPAPLCVYFDAEPTPRHARSYARHQDIEHHEHAKGLIAKRSRASEQRLMVRFLALSPDAQAYYDGL